MIKDALASALQGIFSGISRAANAADRISKSGGDLAAEDLIDLRLAEQEVSANRRVANTVSRMEDEVLRILDKKA